MEFDNKLFCKNVTRLRKLKGYSKYELSIQADIYYQYYCDIENGRVTPNFKGVISIANALDTNITDLISDVPISKNKSIKANIISLIKSINDYDLINKIYKYILMIKVWKGSNND